jgi:hypothetical protein
MPACNQRGPHLHQVWVADGAADDRLHDGHVRRCAAPGLLLAQQRVGGQLHHLDRNALAVPAGVHKQTRHKQRMSASMLGNAKACYSARV